MCGICGFAAAPDPQTLTKMAATLTHRGPDEVGMWESGDVSLAMRRLSIIDLSSGHQPVFNEDESLALVFNGEIYNHVELRAHLETRGHRFRSHHSDSEVLVHLYEEYGRDFLDHLNGMFAIALWDGPRRELILARDRAGIKPLYFSRQGSMLVFGSEPKALLAHPAISNEPDFRAINHYFSLKNIPAPFSAFREISQLRPGELLAWKDGRVETTRWWRFAFREDATVTEEEAAERILALLKDSVRFQMRSDVPFGAYLSGGVDSSSVVALMSEMSERPVRTFTLAYEDRFDHKESDRHHAAMVAKLYKTEHHEEVISSRRLEEALPNIAAAFDEPFSGVISTYFITELIGKHVKVALSGDGADELFASYLPHRLAQPLARRDQGMTTGLDEWGGRADYLDGIRARGDGAARRMGQYLADDIVKRAAYSEKMLALIGDDRTEDLVREHYAKTAQADALNQALYVDFETLLPDQVLAFVDRLSMVHSVEVRPPFLDHRLIEFAATLPGSMKISKGRVKHILKEAVRNLLPPSILDRPKEGFIMPVNAWLIDQLGPYVKSLLAPEKLSRHGLFRQPYVDELLADPKANGNRIWNLAMFQLWWDTYQK